MSADKAHSPYHAPADFRAYVYDAVVLAWETKRVDIISSKFDKKILQSDCGLDVLILDTLAEIQLCEQGTLPAGEFLISLRTDSGYAGLFKRLRDTFAHGHYGVNEQGWITIKTPVPRKNSDVRQHANQYVEEVDRVSRYNYPCARSYLVKLGSYGKQNDTSNSRKDSRKHSTCEKPDKYLRANKRQQE